MLIPPCYDATNKVDCPNRTATCHQTCGAWKEYEQARDEAYEERNRIKDVQCSIYERRRAKYFKHLKTHPNKNQTRDD